MIVEQTEVLLSLFTVLSFSFQCCGSNPGLYTSTLSHILSPWFFEVGLTM